MRLLIVLCACLLVSCNADPARQNNEANELARAGDYAAAIEAYQAAQVAEPDNAVFYFNAAGAYIGASDLASAQAALDQAILRGDANLQSAAYYNLGNMRLQAADLQLAINAYQEALRLNPNNADARYNLELALSQVEQPTPTSVEMQTELEQDQVDPEDQPTPNPSGEELPTPTPTPPEVIPPDPGPSPMFEGDNEEGDEDNNEEENSVERPESDLSKEEADTILDELESESDQVTTFRDNYNVQGTPETDRDW